MKIIAYTFNADAHCVACTQKRTFKYDPASLNAPSAAANDEHGVPIHALDDEGNALRPVFETDEHLGGLDCADCLCEIIVPSPSHTAEAANTKITKTLT